MGSPKCPSAHPWAGPSQNREASRAKPQHDAKADFLGGTRSARPDCDAVRKPRRVIIADELANGRLPCGDMPRLYPGHFCGRAEPAPPRGGPIQGKMA